MGPSYLNILSLLLSYFLQKVERTNVLSKIYKILDILDFSDFEHSIDFLHLCLVYSTQTHSIHIFCFT